MALQSNTLILSSRSRTMSQDEENQICEEALFMVEHRKYTKAQLDELKMIEGMRNTLTEMKMECCN
jgi:hypothetical protein